MASDQGGSALPSGTVTFLLTDVERSTRLWETAPEIAAKAIGRHHELVDEVVAAHGAVRPEEQGEGDSAVAVFGSAGDAVAAALELQRTLAAETWPDGGSLRVRLGLHTGEARLRDPRNYTGVAVHRCARLRDVGHGGQTLLSSVTSSIVADALPAGAWLRDLGKHRLRDLSRAERVFELCHADLPTDFPPLRSLDVLANNLPAQLTSFVGRNSELASLQQLLSSERLVTLTGSGGCGKTRLALQVAAALADRWPDGVWWIDLGAVAEPTRVAELAASTVGVLVEPTAGPLRALAMHLGDRRILVCLDNCEHLVAACAELADTLLRTCPEVSMLATSREPLGVAGETVWRVPSLVEHEAVALFADRGARVRPGFAVDPGDPSGDVVRTVCRRLDGIPLAIELAAAWLRALTPSQIAAELDDRFRLLGGGARGVLARQQTLVASVEWSHDLLDASDQAVFRQLAVFAGGFTLEAARAVCDGPGDDVLAALGRLVDKSLVLADQTEGEARYRLLETIRQYAQQRLQAAGESAVARDRHLDHFLELAETAEPELEAADQDAWLARLEIEHDNLRAALAWGISSREPERGQRLAATLPQLWLRHGHPAEGTEWLRQAIELTPEERSTLQAKLLAGGALVAGAAGQLSLTVDWAQGGVDIATANGDDRHRGRCLGLLAYVQQYLDFTAARELAQECQRCAEDAGDAFGADLGLVMEALALTNQNRHDEAAPLHQMALERCGRRGDRLLVAFTLSGLVYAEARNDISEAMRLASDMLRLAEPLGDYFTLGSAISLLAWVKGLAGEIDEGLSLMDKVVRKVEGAEADIDVPQMLISLGALRLWNGDFQDAIEHFERGARFGEPIVDNLIVARCLPALAAAKRHLGHLDEARDLAERATRLSRHLDAPLSLGRSLDEEAFLAALDDPATAEDLHHEALAVRLAHGMHTHCTDSLDALAQLAARAESLAEATRLLAASDAARQQMGYPRPPIARPGHDATIAGLQEALGADAFEEAWSAGTALSLDEAIAYTRRARGLRQRPSTGWDSLTPTERDVVRLVSEGLTNPEIGSRLFISRETVKTHLSHVYAKLDVSNRTELAALAATHDSTRR